MKILVKLRLKYLMLQLFLHLKIIRQLLCNIHFKKPKKRYQIHLLYRWILTRALIGQKSVVYESINHGWALFIC